MLALLIYGTWAVYVSSEFDLEISLRAGLGQGIDAFDLTGLSQECCAKINIMDEGLMNFFANLSFWI